MKIPERWQWCHPGVFIINFEHILNIFQRFYCFFRVLFAELFKHDIFCVYFLSCIFGDKEQLNVFWDEGLKVFNFDINVLSIQSASVFLGQIY